MTPLELHKSPSTRVERFDTVVIGSGQAGLAVGQQLAARDIDFTILGNDARVGDTWRQRWDSLRLFTPARYSGLPGMLFPAAPNHLADKDEVADYLERYAERFDLPLRLNTRVSALVQNDARYTIHLDGESSVIEADNVVVATGAFQQPHVPYLAADLAKTIHQLHSKDYKSPFTLPDGPVLVVGAGNSGAQIALELARFRKVWLAGRNTGHAPRRILGRDLFDWWWPLMNWASSETRAGKYMRSRMREGGDALIGIPENSLTRAGVVRVGRLENTRGGLPVCGDTVIEPAVVIWCTGYRRNFRWIQLPVFDERGIPRHTRGVVTETPGLFFMGLSFQHRSNSSLLGGVGADATFIAEQIALRNTH